jgi:hypothetical protein
MAVTVNVPSLPAAAVRDALAGGEACAHALRARGLIIAAALVCQRQVRLVTPAQAAHTTALAPSLLDTVPHTP